MNIAFFTPSVAGHRIEYIHHEYIYASKDTSNKYLFILPESFSKVKDLFLWPESSNIIFDFISDEDGQKCIQSNPLKCSYKISVLLRKYAITRKLDHIFLNTLIDGMPFLPFMLPSSTKVSGIIYGIYLWQEKELSFLKRLYNKYCFWNFIHSSIFSNILLLNDDITTEKLNRKHNIPRFVCLPDPIPSIDKNDLRNIREQYNIKSDNIVYLQFPVQKRKHSLELLQAIDVMDKKDLSNKTFLFVGKIENSIKNEFLVKVHQLSDKCQIIVEQGFIPYEALFNFCYSSDFLITLYDNYHMSSGVLGYSAFFNKCLISTNNGLLGHLVNKYNLGYCINQNKLENLICVLNKGVRECKSDYLKNHNVVNFTEAVFSCFK